MNSTLGSVVPLTMFSCDNSCFNLKDLSSTIHGWVSYKYPSANAHIWALDILLSPECCEWQVTVSWSKYGVHLTTARVHSPKRRILTTKHQPRSNIPSSDHFFEFLFSQFSTCVTVKTGWSMSCQRHIWANGCYRTRPQSYLVTWPGQHFLAKQPESPSLVSNVSILVQVTFLSLRLWLHCQPVFLLVLSFTRCVILLNVRGRKWAKIRLPAVYPIHRPRRLRAAPPTFSIFLKLMRGRKIGSWKPNVVEIAKERSQQLPPFPQSERWGAVSCRDLSSSSSKRVEFSGAEQEETVTGVSGLERDQVAHIIRCRVRTILCNPPSATCHILKKSPKYPLAWVSSYSVDLFILVIH